MLQGSSYWHWRTSSESHWTSALNMAVPVSSCGQRPGGEGLQRSDEVDSREQSHPSGEAQSHCSRNVQSSLGGHPHPHILTQTGGKRVNCWCISEQNAKPGSVTGQWAMLQYTGVTGVSVNSPLSRFNNTPAWKSSHKYFFVAITRQDLCINLTSHANFKQG